MTRAKSREPVAGRRLSSPAQEAERIGVSQTLLLQACRDGVLPHRRLGRRVLIDPDEVDAFLSHTGVSLDAALARVAALD
jgi:excisionase family DNA binding protein